MPYPAYTERVVKWRRSRCAEKRDKGEPQQPWFSHIISEIFFAYYDVLSHVHHVGSRPIAHGVGQNILVYIFYNLYTHKVPPTLKNIILSTLARGKGCVSLANVNLEEGWERPPKVARSPKVATLNPLPTSTSLQRLWQRAKSREVVVPTAGLVSRQSIEMEDRQHFTLLT